MKLSSAIVLLSAALQAAVSAEASSASLRHTAAEERKLKKNRKGDDEESASIEGDWKFAAMVGKQNLNKIISSQKVKVLMTKNRIILTKQSGRPLKLKVVIRCRKK